jgi:hypothetical protein
VLTRAASRCHKGSGKFNCKLLELYLLVDDNEVRGKSTLSQSDPMIQGAMVCVNTAMLWITED